MKKKAQGGADAWPSDRYLNVWVCNLADGLLGYAQFPGGPPTTDGVVILYTAFGTGGAARAPFNLGRTATHEIGHWLNLRHIWGDRATTVAEPISSPIRPTSSSRTPESPRSHTSRATTAPTETCS